MKKLGFFILLAVIPAASQPTDPPRRAARFGYAGGAVSLTPAGLQDSTPAELNRPITAGDRFWSAPDGRGEIQTDNAALRFGARTNLIVQELSSDATQIQLTAGSLIVRLHTLAPGESFEVDTPQTSVNFKRIGAYHVEADDKGTLVSVHLGEAEIFKADGATTSIRAGQQARITAGATPQMVPAGALDAFDTWCIERDRREDLAKTAQFVSRDIPGYADLDEHGNWRTIDRYGAVWFPSNMDADWAPYRSGHYIWNDTFGMNWVDGASWGFGPLHYGRWVKVNAEWGWVPGKAGKPSGTFGIRPYYAPALVSWAKFAPGVVRPGAVMGWFPLGPGEAWIPGFRASQDYITGVNLSSTEIADRAVLANPVAARATYMYRDVAMTGEPYEDLEVGRVVGRDYVRVPQSVSEQAIPGPQPVLAATREARIGPKGAAPGAPAEVANRTIVAHRTPASLPAPFVPRATAASPPSPLVPRPTAASPPAPLVPRSPVVSHAATPPPPRAAQFDRPSVPHPLPQSTPRVPTANPAPSAPHPAAPSTSGLSGGLKGFASSVKNTGNKVIHGSNTGAKTSIPPSTSAKPKQPKQPKPAKPSQQPKQN